MSTDDRRSSAGSFVAELAISLGEAELKVLLRLTEIVDRLGEQTCRQIFAEAQRVQADGGLKRADGNLRTLGGVFFKLANKAPSVIDSTKSPVRILINGEPKLGHELRVILSHIAASASAAAAMITDDSAQLSDAAEQKLHDIQSLLGNAFARMRPAKSTTSSTRKFGASVKRPKRPKWNSPPKVKVNNFKLKDPGTAKGKKEKAKTLILTEPLTMPRSNKRRKQGDCLLREDACDYSSLPFGLK